MGKEALGWRLRILSDATFTDGGFSEPLSGINTGSRFEIQPPVPGLGVLVVEIESSPPVDAVDLIEAP